MSGALLRCCGLAARGLFPQRSGFFVLVGNIVQYVLHRMLAINYDIEIYFGNIILLYHIGTIPCNRIELPQLIPGIYPLKV